MNIEKPANGTRIAETEPLGTGTDGTDWGICARTGTAREPELDELGFT